MAGLEGSSVAIKEYYRNMKYDLDKEPRASWPTRSRPSGAPASTPHARLDPRRHRRRRVSAKGLPTPNIFTGEQDFHGKKEWVPLEWMEKSVETILHLMDVWVERNSGQPTVASGQ